MSNSCLSVQHLSVSFTTPQGPLEAVRDISFDVQPGEVFALVGESGCGKSVLCRAIMQLLPRNAQCSGSIVLSEQEILHCSERELQRLRGAVMSMLFQDPLSTLHPSLSVGAQIEEVLLRHKLCSRQEAARLAIVLLGRAGIPDPELRVRSYPHELSGGMRQRCVLTIALAAGPALLLADEPTTALDATVQIHLLDLLRQLAKETQMALVLVTHDLGVVARVADRVAVMYAGKIVEIGTAEEIFYDPRHPYTWCLLRAHPAFACAQGLSGIPGRPVRMQPPPPGDAFAERNPWALNKDFEEMPPLFPVSETHSAATWLLDPRSPHVERPELLWKSRHE